MKKVLEVAVTEVRAARAIEHGLHPSVRSGPKQGPIEMKPLSRIATALWADYMMHPRRTNPRAEYRQRQIERAHASVSLAEKFPGLSSLKVNLAYLDAETFTGNSQMKYSVNVRHAKSVFCFMCPCTECVGGDFDLSGELEKAIAKRKRVVVGEMRCLGWQGKAKIERAPCRILLRYTLKLFYD